MHTCYRLSIIFTSFLILAFCSPASYAVPAYKGVIEYVQPDGSRINIRVSGDEHSHWVATEDGYLLLGNDNGGYEYAIEAGNGEVVSSRVLARDEGMRNSATLSMLAKIDKKKILGKWISALSESSSKEHQTGIARKSVGLFPDANFPTTGSPKALIILVEYNDVKFSTPSAHSYFEGMVNTPGFAEYGATGSVKDWFADNSGGQFTPEFDVFGPVTLSGNRSYYGGNNANGNDQAPHKMAVEACDILNATVDFSKYDNDGDGVIDNVFIFYAGHGENRTAEADAVWPHTSWVTKLDFIKHVYDGVTLDRYACTNELYDKRPDGIGTFCHEFSHVMGLPDLYNTTTGSQTYTPGVWSVMDYGPYLNDGRTPPLYSSFERMALGWLTPQSLTDNRSFALRPLSENTAFRVSHPDKEECFLFENRQSTGWDRFLPAHGMLVWHMEYVPEIWDKRIVNNDPEHQYVDLVEADNIRSELTRAGDVFPGADEYSDFSASTIPAFAFRDKSPAPFSLSMIRERPDGNVTFRTGIGSEPPANVESMEITEVNCMSIKVRWTRVPGISKYIIRLQGAGDVGYTEFLAEDVNEYEVGGLMPQLRYKVGIVAYDGFEESPVEAKAECVTAAPDIDYYQAVIAGISDISESSFRVEWWETPLSESYIINVAEIKKGDPFVDVVDFSDGIENLPGKWNTNSRLTFANNAYSGESPLSLRLSADGDYISSGQLDDRAYSLTFWHRGSGTSEEDAIVVSGLVDGQWKALERYPVTSVAGGATISLALTQENMYGVRIALEKGSEKGSLAIDDIRLEWGGERTEHPHYKWGDCNVGNVLQMEVDNLKADTEYKVTVKASDGELFSRSSEPMYVTTRKAGAIGSVKKDNEESKDSQYYNIDGYRTGVRSAHNKKVIIEIHPDGTVGKVIR